MPRIAGWTEQHPAVLERIDADGVYVADGRRVPVRVRMPFQWMRQQMRDRLPGTTGRVPIWLTTKPTLQRRRLCTWSCAGATAGRWPLCNLAHITPGKTWMRLSLPAERVLLSDFELWDRYVIRGRYVPEDADDEARWERRVGRRLGLVHGAAIPPVERSWPDGLIAELIGSWPRIFDVLDAASVQGAFERLDRPDVKDIVHGPEPGELHPVWRRSPTSPYGWRNSR